MTVKTLLNTHKKKPTCKNAFTFAEMVIALAILGIIASLTIPVFFTSGSATNNSIYAAGLKKAYSQLIYANVRITSSNSGTMAGSWSTVSTPHDNLRNIFAGTLKFTQLCDEASAKTNCWAPSYYKVDGSANGLDLSTYSMGGLSDGSLLVFRSLSGTCANAVVTSDGTNIGCGEIYVDVNGFKAPNRFGRDIYLFYISRTKIIPNGDTGTTGANCPNNGGLECTASVLQNGKIVY